MVFGEFWNMNFYFTSHAAASEPQVQFLSREIQDAGEVSSEAETASPISLYLSLLFGGMTQHMDMYMCPGVFVPSPSIHHRLKWWMVMVAMLLFVCVAHPTGSLQHSNTAGMLLHLPSNISTQYKKSSDLPTS